MHTHLPCSLMPLFCPYTNVPGLLSIIPCSPLAPARLQQLLLQLRRQRRQWQQTGLLLGW